MSKLTPLLLASVLCPLAVAQFKLPPQPEPLDPTRDLSATPASAHAPLPEQYLWTANDVTVHRPDRSKFSWARSDLRVEPHFFRAHFKVDRLPDAATLYIAGPREAHVFLNGHALGDFYTDPDGPINFRVFHVDAKSALRPGDNVIAISAVRGKGVVSGAGPIATQQMAYGEVFAAKIVPRAFGVEAPALVVSDPTWRSTANLAPHWSEATFDDSAWPHPESLGPVEADIDLRQWSADAGMYGWPGYMGISPELRTTTVPAAAVTHVFTGRSAFNNLPSLTASTQQSPFTVTNSTPPLTDAEAPSLLLDFGREIAGRILIESASNADATVSIAYGESEIEAMATGLTSGQQGGNYLGTNLLDVPANGVARGPKSAFRYVRIRFLRGAPVAAFKSIRAEAIFYPVTYAGSFDSSDPLLNRIWENGAYTAHLCMQDGIWDAPKRDRGRWIGDVDIEGRVISTAFGDKALLEDTIARLAEATPASQYVNGIAGYSALWLTSLDNLYLHSGDKAFLATQHAAILRILTRLDQDFAPDNLLSTSAKGWGFVDWSPGLYGLTPETRIGTNLQYLRGFEAATRLLQALHDEPNATHYAQRTETLRNAAKTYLEANGTLGRTWQLNSLAILDRLGPSAPIWSNVLAHIKQDSPTDQSITPYFNAYVLDAISLAGHPTEALDWIRTYWGGMLAEGATSLWENYDLRWPKGANAHLSLQADGTSGYFVSLAHGWSSGPTAWLAENVLGITPTAPGYDKVDIHPSLLGLAFASGTVPTPHGIISIRIDQKQGITLDLPANITATVHHGAESTTLNQAGHYTYPSP